MPNDLASVVYTWNNRKAEAKPLFRGEEARYSKTSTVLVRNQSSRNVRFLFFNGDDLAGLFYEPFPGVGDKMVSPKSDLFFTPPSATLTPNVQVRMDGSPPQLLGDNRRTAQMALVNLGDTLTYLEDGSYTMG
ncbi:MAG: hypothetical protein ABIN89_14485 [Chitinophagaceae bacterium]